MPDKPITADQLSGPRWRERVHEHLVAVSEPVDPLAERAAREVSRRYRESRTSAQLAKEQVADALNRLDDQELPLELRLLLTQPYVLVRAVEHAQSEGTSNEDDPTRSVRAFMEDDAHPAFVEALVDAAEQEGLLESLARDHDLQPGDIVREDLLQRLRAGGIDIRRGRPAESIAESLRGLRAARAAEERAPAEAPATGAATGDAPGVTGEGLDEPCLTSSLFATGQRPPQFWDVDCGQDPPCTDVPVGSPPRGDVLALARTISLLYMFGERQPSFDAMDALRDRVLTGRLLNPLGPGARQVSALDQSGTADDDDLCNLRIWISSWGQDSCSLTLQQRATVAATIGIRDSASRAPVNVGFARAMDQLVELLVALATRCCTDTLDLVRPAACVASLQLAGALDGALTGQTLIDVGFWRREFTIATQVLAHQRLRALLGVGDDPDPSPAPTIRQVLPGVVFDAAALNQELTALKQILTLAEKLLNSGISVGDDEFRQCAAAAVTLRVLTGRLNLSGLTDAASTGSSGAMRG
jgi:hypothetical protein